MSAAEALAPDTLQAPPGATGRIVLDMASATYFADPCERPSLSASIATVIDRQSPAHAHARHPRLGGVRRADTKSLDAGSLIHTMLLGQGKAIAVVDADDWRSKAAQLARDNARAEGKVPALRKDFDGAVVAATRLRERLDGFGVELAGASEPAVLWTETARGGGEVLCRGMLDHLIIDEAAARATIYDLKSARSAHPDALGRHIDTYGYAIQRAAYVRAIEAARPDLAGRVDFVLLFVELEAPYVALPVRLSGAFRALGEQRWARAVDIWERCLREDRWPAYAEATVEIEPPPWALTRELARETEEEDLHGY